MEKIECPLIIISSTIMITDAEMRLFFHGNLVKMAISLIFMYMHVPGFALYIRILGISLRVFCLT